MLAIASWTLLEFLETVFIPCDDKLELNISRPLNSTFNTASVPTRMGASKGIAINGVLRSKEPKLSNEIQEG